MKEKIKISLYSEFEKNWISDFTKIISALSGVHSEVVHTLEDQEQVVFIHENEKNILKIIHQNFENEIIFFLITEQKNKIPSLLKQGAVEDALFYPFQMIEVLGKLKLYQNILLFRELRGVQTRLSKIIESTQDQVEVAARLKKKFKPKRFQKFKSITPHYRYFAGEKSGGNYFDILPNSQESMYSFLFSDVSSYGLSSLILTLILSIAQKINTGEWRDPQQTSQYIFQEMLSVLKQKDQCSLFLGSFSRFNLMLQYIHLGDNILLHSKKDGDFNMIPPSGPALQIQTAFDKIKTQTLTLAPHDQIVFLSHGFCMELGGVEQVMKEIQEFSNQNSEDLFEHLTLQLRAVLKKNKKDLPERDCTISCIEISDKAIPLRKIEKAG